MNLARSCVGITNQAGEKSQKARITCCHREVCQDMAYCATLPSRIDIAAACSLREKWLSEIGSEQQVVLDCAGVETFSAAAAQAVLSFASMLNATGGSLTLRNAPEPLQADFSVLGLPQQTWKE